MEKNVTKLIENAVRREIKKSLPELIRREVKRQLPSLMKEEVARQLLSLLTEQPNSSSETVVHSQRKSTVVDTPDRPRTRKKPTIRTGNNILDEVLKQTTGGIPRESSFQSLMSKDMFTTDDIDLIANRQTLTNAMNGVDDGAPIVATGHSRTKLNTDTPAGQAVANALTRDYSALVKRF